MSEVTKTEDIILVPKTPEEQLKQLIQLTCKSFNDLSKQNLKQKSNPLYSLWRDGLLTFEFIMKEIELIRLKKSSLSSGQRSAVITIVGTAIELFQKNLKKPTEKISVEETKSESKS